MGSIPVVEFDAFLARLESENADFVAERLKTEIDVVLGRPKKVLQNQEVNGRVSSDNGARPAFDWFQSLSRRLPPVLSHDDSVELAVTVEAGLFAREVLVSDQTHLRQYRRELRQLEAEGMAAFQSLVLANLRLVFHWAKGVAGSIGDEEVQDAFQAGAVGLIRGLQGWDHQQGYRVSTFVSWHIRQQIQRWRMNETTIIRIPVHVWEKLEKYVEGEVEVAPVSAARAALAIRYLDDVDPYLLDEIRTRIHEQAFNDAIDRLEMADTVEPLLGSLDAKQRLVLSMRFGLDGDEPMTLEAIGVHFGVSRERIRQIEKKALTILRGRS